MAPHLNMRWVIWFLSHFLTSLCTTHAQTDTERPRAEMEPCVCADDGEEKAGWNRWNDGVEFERLKWDLADYPSSLGLHLFVYVKVYNDTYVHETLKCFVLCFIWAGGQVHEGLISSVLTASWSNQPTQWSSPLGVHRSKWNPNDSSWNECEFVCSRYAIDSRDLNPKIKEWFIAFLFEFTAIELVRLLPIILDGFLAESHAICLPMGTFQINHYILWL